MMLVNLTGTTFVDYELLKEYRMRLDANQKVECLVELRDVSPVKPETIYESDYAILANGKDLIGWIPKLATLKKYIGKAFRERDQWKHDTQYQRAKWCRKIRDNVTIDITRNNIQPTCIIDGIYHLQNKKAWGVVVAFNYD
jgi:hypothetical protein